MKRDKAGPTLMEGAVWCDVAGVSIELLRLGKGRPLLFLHGMDGLEGSLDVIRQLANQFEVFAPSHPGFGASQLPSSIDTVDDIAYLYLDLLEKLALANTVVVAMSFGGWIASEMLIKSRSGVSQLVLGAPLGLRTSDRRRQDMKDIFMIPAQAAERLLQASPISDINPAEIEDDKLRRIFRNREAVSLFGWSPYLNDPKLKQRLHRVKVPTLVVWGADDALIPPKYGMEFAAALPDARLETIATCGHRIAVDQPGRLVDLIAKFSLNAPTTETAHARLAV
jgi:pimeloyl-ACP methyl ester carboxylesterase